MPPQDMLPPQDMQPENLVTEKKDGGGGEGTNPKIEQRKARLP
jgi:hypothetical protein